MSANPVTSDPVQAEGRYGEVFDRGFAHYDGPRRGRRGAMTSLIGYSMKRAMGIRKSWTAKIMPFLLYLSAAIPLIVMIGISAVVPQFEFGNYSSYLQGIFVLIGIFVAIGAPEMVCPDRQERTLPLYFARAIGRMDYVWAKFFAMTLLTMTLSVIPVILLWFGKQLTAESVGTAMKDHISDLWKAIFAGLCVAIVLSALGLMVSSFTKRKGVAITVIIIGFLVLTNVVEAAAQQLDEYDWSRYLLALDLSTLFSSLYNHLFHDQETTFVRLANFSLAECLLFMAGYVVFSLIVLRWRYAPRDDT